VAAPLPETAISRFKARTRKIKTPDDREQHCELTKGEIEGVGRMEAVVCVTPQVFITN
jgi:hypothetical protein